VAGPAKILAIDDEADFELPIRRRFRRQIRDQEFAFRFARHGEPLAPPKIARLRRDRASA